MSGLLRSLLIIVLINNQELSAQIPSFSDIETVIRWTYNFYKTGNTFVNPDRTRQNVIEILDKVDKLSTDFHAFIQHVDIKLDVMLNTILTDFEIESNLQGLKESLSNYLNIIDHHFDNAKKYYDSNNTNSFSKKELEKFADSVILGANNIPNIVENIYRLFFPGSNVYLVPGFMSLFIHEAVHHLPKNCDRYISEQQRFHYIFINIIFREIKAFETLRRAHFLMKYIDENTYNYENHLNQTYQKFYTRLRSYFELYSKSFNYVPTLVRRCDINVPERGVNFIELENFSRVEILDVANVNPRATCLDSCTRNPVIFNQNQDEKRIYDCFDVGHLVDVCRAEPNTSREFFWWKTKNGTMYGHQLTETMSECYHGGKESIEGRILPTVYIRFYCNMCACSVDKNKAVSSDDASIWKISMANQKSDIEKNMVVTGVKFVNFEHAIHLQIQQSVFVPSVTSIEGNSMWKPLNLFFESESDTDLVFPYKTLRSLKKSIFLDDVTVPQGYVVTGVRFAVANKSAFKLEIHGTRFDSKTGILDASSGNWFNADTNTLNPQDYTKPRRKIDMKRADNPIRIENYDHQVETNTVISFIHTDVMKDAGQATIPYIDIQPVYTKPPFPLNAIGISFRGQRGYSGYIVPRIYTLNVSNHLTML